MNSRERFLSALDPDRTPDRTPVWFMRQAGRLFKEYRSLRETHEFKEVCQNPELNARVTCMPIEKLNVDAAIIFADILLPLEGMGSGFKLVPGEGPVIDNPVRTPEDVKTIRAGSPEYELDYVYSAIRASIERLPDGVPLIGFAGAPFTLASYLIEGGKSRSHLRTRTFMLEHPGAWNQLMTRIVEATVTYLKHQIEAGAEVLQLFDSWVGQLSPSVYREHVLEHTQKIFEAIPETPVIHFGTKTAGLLGAITEMDPDVLGLDWRITLNEVHERVDADRPVQGNLDPSLLLTSFDVVRDHLDRILREGRSHPGHVFNLGHGILPETEPDIVRKTVEYVHDWDPDG